MGTMKYQDFTQISGNIRIISGKSGQLFNIRTISGISGISGIVATLVSFYRKFNENSDSH